jgi:hypothetical protein
MRHFAGFRSARVTTTVQSMTKDGRPSRINDIRYFHGNIHKYLEGIEDAVAFGRRLAWFLNGENFSLGAYPSLYIFFTPTLEPGAVHITDYGGDWWQRYTHVGVSHDFPNLEGSERVITGTIAALKAIRPDLETTIAGAEQTVRTHGDRLRFLLKSRQTKHFKIDISFNIAVWPQPSSLFVSLTDLSSGAFLEAPPIPIRFYGDAFHLAGGIRITGAAATVLPNRSVAAKVTASLHDPVVREITEFLPRTPPVLSKLVKRRG